MFRGGTAASGLRAIDLVDRLLLDGVTNPEEKRGRSSRKETQTFLIMVYEV
jgi:hypothetical protein